MRDPNRIRKVMANLEKLWNMYPDYRLGQLITNLGINFFMEDDEIQKRISNYIKAKGCNHPGVFRGGKCDVCGVQT